MYKTDRSEKGFGESCERVGAPLPSTRFRYVPPFSLLRFAASIYCVSGASGDLCSGVEVRLQAAVQCLRSQSLPEELYLAGVEPKAHDAHDETVGHHV